MSHDLRRWMVICETFLHGFRPSYNPTVICEVFKNPSGREYRQIYAKNNQVRAFLTGPDILIWNVFAAMHQTVREQLQLDPDEAIPLNLYGRLGGEAMVMVTDNTRNTVWWHNRFVANVIDEHPFMAQRFTSVHVSYYDEDIVGDWSQIDDDEDT